MYCKIKKQLGFSILELIIVMMILGILMLISIPTFQDFMSDAKDVNRSGSFSEMGKGLDLSILSYINNGGDMTFPDLSSDGYYGNIYNISGDYGVQRKIAGSYTGLLLEYSKLLPPNATIHVGGLERDFVADIDNVIDVRTLNFPTEYNVEYFSLHDQQPAGYNPITVANIDMYYRYLCADNDPNSYALSLVFDKNRKFLAFVIVNDGYISVNGKDPFKAIVVK